MKNRISALLVLFIISFSSYANPGLTAAIEKENPDKDIDNGIAEVTVQGGQAPYTYKWSLQSVPLESNKAEGLTEGSDFTVTIIDSNQDSLVVTDKIPAESTQEVLNSWFKPIVDVMFTALFWDPFEAIGIYDPVVYSDMAKVKSPQWENPEVKTIQISEWYVDHNQRVQEGDMIAEVLVDDEEKYKVYATTNGKLEHLAEEGKMFFDLTNVEDVVEIGTENIANIVYDQPRPVLHPNGDVQEKGIPIIVVWLVLGALFFTIRMKFINFRGVKHAIHLVQGKYDNPEDKGEVSHFQALTTALSATVGLGNIAGVAVAIVIGGPGATFWMIIAGLIGMASKFTECTLGVKYRTIDVKGEVSGGPMYYLSQGLEKRNMKGLGKILAVVFAILCIGASFGGGNMFQANQAFAQLSGQFPMMAEGGYGVIFGIILAILVGVVIIGGIKSIAKVTDKIVPFMCGIYILFSLIIIGMNITHIDDVFAAIYNGAFNAPALKGGILGVLIVGFQRAAFSNEAGVGSASIAHSASKTNEPVSEGIVALLEPFVDTVLVCTMTALVLVFTGFADGSSGYQGAELTSAAFSSVFPWFSWVLMVAILLFAFSTMVSWSYYGQKAWGYIFGKSKAASLSYKFLFLVFIVIGSSVGLGAVLDFSDLMILGMAFPNILGLVLLSSEVRKDMMDYFRRIKSGEVKQHKKETE